LPSGASTNFADKDVGRTFLKFIHHRKAGNPKNDSSDTMDGEW